MNRNRARAHLKSRHPWLRLNIASVLAFVYRYPPMKIAPGLDNATAPGACTDSLTAAAKAHIHTLWRRLGSSEVILRGGVWESPTSRRGSSLASGRRTSRRLNDRWTVPAQREEKDKPMS